MAIEVAKTISIDARNTLIRNRDALQAKHGVKMFFPKNLVRGAYQDMILKGGSGGVARAEREIDVILIEWKREFEAFKERRARRKVQDRVVPEDTWGEKFPTLAKVPASKKKTTLGKNSFSALMDGDGRVVQETVPEIAQVPAPVTKTKEPVLRGWAAMAAKAPVVEKKEPKATAPKKFTFGEKGSGAAFQLEEFPPIQPFNWADCVDEESEDDSREGCDEVGGWDAW